MLKSLSLGMELVNEAFAEEPGVEIARILRDVAREFDGMSARELTGYAQNTMLHDINGNHVGQVKIR